jgi:hypothetical protein
MPDDARDHPHPPDPGEPGDFERRVEAVQARLIAS